MLTLAALPPEIIGAAALAAIVSGALAIMAWRGYGPPATAWWSAALLLDTLQALCELIAPGIAVAGVTVSLALQTAQCAATLMGALRWFGQRLSLLLISAALVLATVTYADGVAGFAAGAAINLGVAAWLLGSKRLGPRRLTVMAGFALMGAIDALTVGSPDLGWSHAWPTILAPVAGALIAVGLAAFALGMERPEPIDRQLKIAIDQAAIGLALYDRNDRLAFANQYYLGIHGEPGKWPKLGERFEDVLRRLNADGFFAGGTEEREQAIKARMARHRNPAGPLILSLADGRFIRVLEHRMNDGSTIGTWTDITELKRREDGLSLAISGRKSSTDFLEVAVRAVARGLGYRWAMIGRRSGSGDLGEIIAAWDADHMITPSSYSLADTPCADVLGTGYCFVPDRVTERYPRDIDLAQKKARAYCGAIMSDANGEPLGHVFAINDRPDREGADHRAFMAVMADWISTEIGRRDAEAALKASEQRVRDFAEAASEWFWETGPDLRFTYISSRMLDATGINPAALIGLTRADVFGDAGSPTLRRHLDALADRRPFRDFRYLSSRAFGPSRHLSISGKPLFDGAGNFVGYRGTGRDVTKEQDAVAEAMRKTALLDAAVANMAEGFSIIDRDGRLVVANHVLGRLLDLPDVLRDPGTPVRDILRFTARRGDYGNHDGSDKAIDELVEARFAFMRSSDSHAFERVTPRGGVVEVRGQRLPTGELVTSYIDISHFKAAETAIRRAKEAAELANRAKSEFLATISHELRTPLNAIIGFSEIIRDQTFGPQSIDRYRGYAGDINDSGVHLLNIINDILDIAKIEAGAVLLHLSRFDVGDLVEQAMRLMRQRATDADIAVTIDIPANLPHAEGDQRRLKQVFLNLISNAIKFTPRGGSVAISARWEDPDMTIMVADSGIGMTEADIQVALEPFRQVESHLSRSVEGTGLGLPLARALMSLHHGSLNLESALGQGTRAIVRLPLHQPRQPGDIP